MNSGKNSIIIANYPLIDLLIRFVVEINYLIIVIFLYIFLIWWLQTLPKSKGWAVPAFGGVCGRLEVVAHEGEPLSSLLHVAWYRKLKYAQMIIKAAMDFTFQHERWVKIRFFWYYRALKESTMTLPTFDVSNKLIKHNIVSQLNSFHT